MRDDTEVARCAAPTRDRFTRSHSQSAPVFSFVSFLQLCNSTFQRPARSCHPLLLLFGEYYSRYVVQTKRSISFKETEKFAFSKTRCPRGRSVLGRSRFVFCDDEVEEEEWKSRSATAHGDDVGHFLSSCGSREC